MAATALLQFSQLGVGTGNPGEAFLGVLGNDVTVTNADDTGVVSWEIELHNINQSGTAFDNNGNTPVYTISPGTSTSYRFVLRVWSVPNRVGTPDDEDIRVFSVLSPNGVILPPAQIWPPPLPNVLSGLPNAKPNEMNFGGVNDTVGWAGITYPQGGVSDGLLNDTLAKLFLRSARELYVSVNGTAPYQAPNAAQSGSVGLPFSDLQQAMDVIADSSFDTAWTVYLAPGDYNSEDLVIPGRRKIAIVGSDYQLTSLNVSDSNTMEWEISGTSYLSFKNVKVFMLTAVDGANVPTNTGTLVLDNASLGDLVNTGSYPIDLIAVGPSTHVGLVNIKGRCAVDGIDYLGEVFCGSFVAYDALLAGGDLTITTGDATVTDCQIDAGTSFTFSGYAQNFYMDGFSNYWRIVSGVSVNGEHNFVVADTGNLFIPKDITSSGSSYSPVLEDQGRMVSTTVVSTVTITMAHDDDVNFPIGAEIQFYQGYFGELVFQGVSGVAILCPTVAITRGRYSRVTLAKVAANNWQVSGDTLPTRNLTQKSSTSEFLLAVYNGGTLEVDNASPITVTLPNFSTIPLPVGYEADIVQGDVGRITLTPEDGGVTLVSEGGLTTLNPGSRVKALKYGSNSWFIHGDVAKYPTIFPLTGSSNTLGHVHNGKFLTVSNATASTLLVPKNSVTPFPIGTVIPFARIGVGAVVVAPADGTVTTVLPVRGSFRCLGEAHLRKIATDTWILSGDEAANDYDLVGDFGADPTGVVAADTALANFLTEAAAAGGGATLNVPRGVFKLTTHFTITVDNIAIVASKGASFKKVGTNFNMIDLKGNFGEVHGLELNGNDQALGAGILITGSNNEVSRCYIHDVGDVTDHAGYGNGSHGICIDGQSTTCQYNRCNRNTIIDCHDIGISHNKAIESRLMDNRIWGNGLEGFTFDNNAHRCQAIGNRLRGNCAIGGAASISLDSSDTGVLIGNIVTATVGVDGLKTNNNLSGGCHSWVCNGNQFIDNTAGYGVHLFTGAGDGGTASASYWTITGNVFRGNGTGTVRLESGTANNQVRANSLNGTAVSDAGSGNVVN